MMAPGRRLRLPVKSRLDQERCRHNKRRGGPFATPQCSGETPAGRENTSERAMSDVLSALLHFFSDHHYSWLAQFFSLLVLPFAHEDLAIILGAYVVVNEIM